MREARDKMYSREIRLVHKFTLLCFKYLSTNMFVKPQIPPLALPNP